MATYDWPLALGAPKSLDFQLVQTTVHARSMFGFHGQTVDLHNERWTTKLNVDIRDSQTGAKYEAFLASLRKGTHFVRLPRFDRLTPAGTLQSSAGVMFTALKGSKSVVLFAPYGSTLLAGDLLEVDGQLLEVAEDCSADFHGKVTVPTVNKLKRAVSGVSRDSTATEVSGLGVVSTVAADVLRTSYGTGKNLYWGDNLLVAGTGAYGVGGATLKNGTQNPRGLKPGDVLTISATLWRDALAQQDGATSTLYLWTADSVGTWTGSAIVSSSSLTGEFKSASITLPAAASMYAVAVGLYHQNGVTNYAGTVSAKDIQVELGSSATSFAVGRQPLLENSATNLLLHSSAFNETSVWGVAGTVTVTANNTTAPDGTLTADRIDIALGGGADRIDQVVPDVIPAAGDTYTYSVWLKGTGNVGITVNTTSGLGGSNEVYLDLTDSWVRYTATHTFTSGVTGALRVHGIIMRNPGVATVYAWGAQLEAGAVATSHNPTTTAKVTRAADVINTSVNLQSPTATFKLVSKGAVTYGTGGVMQAMELDFEEAPL